MTHPTITKELAVQLAREAGMLSCGHSLDPEEVAAAERFAQAIYKLGRNAGLEEAKQACIEKLKTYRMHSNFICANAIESLKDNTP